MPAISGGELFQNAVYVGINLQDILYGVELVLYFNTMYSLVAHREKRRKSDLFYAVFSTVMLFLVTIWIFTQEIFGEKMWLLDANFPGGPNAFWDTYFSVWYMNLGTTAITALQLMTDALMIYRCYIIWNSSHVAVVPIMLWIATLVLGVAIFFHSSVPGGNFFSGTAAQLGLAYYTVSIFLTAMLTCLICYRMVQYGQSIRKQLGKEYASPYYAVVALVVESVFPHTLSGIAFLVSFGMKSQISVGFSCVYILFMCISPQMLILRVARGDALAGKTRFQSTIQFCPAENVSTSGSRLESTDDSDVMHVRSSEPREKDNIQDGGSERKGFEVYSNDV